MISKLKILDKFLNLLLVFLFPTQLAAHFWPSFALIFGIRVDYLAPAIYLTDILFLVVFIPWALRSIGKIIKDVKKNWVVLVLLLSVCFINIIFSQSREVSLIKWTRLIEMLFLGYYVLKRGDIFSIKNVERTLLYSLIFFGFLGLLQFINGHTTGNIFYIFGERYFSIFTPGIALVNLLGRNFLRIYSTFPHPNSLAGFFGVSILFLMFNISTEKKWLKIAGLLIILTTFVLTFSLSAYVGLGVCLLAYLISKRGLVGGKALNLFLIFVYVASFYLAVFARPLMESRINFSQSTEQRIELADTAGKIFSKNWVTGTGLNTFIIKGTSFAKEGSIVWFLQPVHNIYLLIFAESGVLGITLLYFLFSLLFKKSVKNTWSILIIIFILVTGLFDHYWFTIQQNLLIMSFFFGLSLREKV